MQNETNETDNTNAPACHQADNLIAFLYGELSTAHAQTFQRHARDCSSCNQELEDFGGVRRSVIAWRDESLGGSLAAAAASGVVPVARSEKPSALAAVREFFKLSPLWMKGAVAFATLLLCILAGLSLARLRTTTPAPLAPAPLAVAPANKAYSDGELNALVERRVQDELNRIKNSTAPPQSPQTTPVVAVHQYKRVPKRRSATSGQVAANSSSRRPLSKREPEQLPADLRLVSINSDNDLVLLDDGINQ